MVEPSQLIEVGRPRPPRVFQALSQLTAVDIPTFGPEEVLDLGLVELGTTKKLGNCFVRLGSSWSDPAAAPQQRHGVAI